MGSHAVAHSYDNSAPTQSILAQSTQASPVTSRETLELGKQVIAAEARALVDLLGGVDESFSTTVELLRTLRGSLIVTGMGKAGLIGQKLTATFASTGTRSHFLHPAEAFHGDLGRVHRDDAVLVLSQSGETGEVLQLLPTLRSLGVPIIAITATHDNTLARNARIVLPLGRLQEACFHGLAPSTSTTVMLALGDALALVTSQLRGFAAEDFARFHPGGSLGFKLSSVNDHMRPLVECRLANQSQTIREVLVASTRPGRRSGAVMLTDDLGRLTGLFTDSDLARLIESRNDAALDAPIATRMITSPTTIASGDPMADAIEILAQRKLSELPVVDAAGCPLGMIDVTDVVGQLPKSEESTQPAETPTVKIFPRS